ncbi:MAG: hypothetical protein NC097_07930 [Clostridium sp.]|nr:hypothetical protein [Prevotella sp.]MCM1429708.1 hypothetical protein [Clostridium sp.]MCM1474634.1 hypothetical protein [Muribaculaceae bacterium]
MDTSKMTENIPATLSEGKETKFKGYSIEDLRYRRALVALQKEFAKSKILNNVHKVQRHSPFSKNFGAGKSTAGKAGALAGKLLNGLNYLDYLMLGFTLFNSGKKIFGFFRKKK